MRNRYEINQTDTISYITLPALGKPEAIRHGFTIKGNSGKRGATPVDFTSSPFRRMITEALGLTPHHPAMVRQIHGDRTLVIDESIDHGMLDRSISADAMITDMRGLAMALLTADCLPLLLVNAEAGAAGIIHAGRRGTLLGIAAKAVHKMQEVYGARPRDTLAAFGPAIGPCCYEVGREVAEGFRRKYSWWEKVLSPGEGGRFHLDLFQANRMQLLEVGIEGDNIIEPSLCTSCQSSLFYSYRRDGGIKGHIFSFIMLPG